MTRVSTAEFVETDLIEEREAEVAALATPLPDGLEGLDWDQIQAMIDAAVARQAAREPEPVGTVPVPLTHAVPQAPPSYKKHYRCDLSPDLWIQKLDMTALDRGERPSANPLPGESITFRMSHLYTSDDGVIRQLEWMKSRGTHSSDGSETMGGNPSIYEDDGGDVYRCTAGCDYFTASKNAWMAHMWGTHQLQVGT